MLMRNYMVPGYMPLIAIIYKYNYRKFLSFVSAVVEGSTKSGITYLSYHPGQFSISVISPVARPLVISKFFGYFNDVDSHNNLR